MDKKDIKVLFERRKELQKQINELQAEYEAIGNALQEIIKYEEREKDDGR